MNEKLKKSISAMKALCRVRNRVISLFLPSPKIQSLTCTVGLFENLHRKKVSQSIRVSKQVQG